MSWRDKFTVEELEHRKKMQREYRARKRRENPEAVNAQWREWESATKEKTRARGKRYRAKHGNKGWKKQYATKPVFRLRHNLRTRLRCALKGMSGYKISSALALLGMDFEEFRIYIRGQFRPGMTWENHGPVWELDHIIPCASFNLSDPEQQKVCFRWDNYQPLFSKENRQKGAKVWTK